MMSSFDFPAQYTLENAAALLRPLTVEDYAHLLPVALQDPSIWTYSLQAADNPENFERYIQSAVHLRSKRKGYPFIVFDKRLNVCAGSTRFYHIDLKNRTTCLGYTWYGKAHQGTGLNKHCKLLLLDFAFDVMDMVRVEFNADTRNEHSIRAMKSIGCTVEGVLRSHKRLPSGYQRDTIVLSMLREEWRQEKRATLLEKIKKFESGKSPADTFG